ncbi:MAG: hypothetical protein ACXW3D_07685 [Caulobacteraceae bacterium]
MKNEVPPPEKRFKHPIGSAVHSILWNEWDPIGVRHFGDWPDDEYDFYIWPLISKITRSETVEQIADYLDWAANENMGMGGDPALVRASHLRIASKLHALRSQPEQH